MNYVLIQWLAVGSQKCQTVSVSKCQKAQKGVHYWSAFSGYGTDRFLTGGGGGGGGGVEVWIIWVWDLLMIQIFHVHYNAGEGWGLRFNCV